MVKVLALDDENHSCMFVTEHGKRFYDACEFIKECLAPAHTETYDVRGFAIIEPLHGPLKDLEDDVIDDLFYFVEGAGPCPEELSEENGFQVAFNLLWNSSNERWRS